MSHRATAEYVLLSSKEESLEWGISCPWMKHIVTEKNGIVFHGIGGKTRIFGNKFLD